MARHVKWHVNVDRQNCENWLEGGAFSRRGRQSSGCASFSWRTCSWRPAWCRPTPPPPLLSALRAWRCALHQLVRVTLWIETCWHPSDLLGLWSSTDCSRTESPASDCCSARDWVESNQGAIRASASVLVLRASSNAMCLSAGAAICLAFIHNLLRRHPACTQLLHRPGPAPRTGDSRGFLRCLCSDVSSMQLR